MKPNWSASDIPRLNGRVAIVTGANSGVGYEIALQLVLHGAHVVLAARDKGRMEEAVKRIKMTAAEAKVGTQLLDLADLDSVRQFAREFSDQHDGVACREHVQRHCTVGEN
jgi:NAD(P)-dependent dehydrogenase (short-subunit alcohol dehydrogenase family)